MDTLLYRFAAIVPPAFPYIPRYNIAPTQPILAIVSEDQRRVFKQFRWGLIPAWAKDSRLASKMINARSETLTEKPAFKTLLKSRRCLIPADGFYEWMQTNGKKQPFYIHLKSKEPFAFAGLWDQWLSPSGPVYTCTIITTKANSLITPLHDRMPVILQRDHEHIWLDGTIHDPQQLLPLLQPFSDEAMTCYPVQSIVNSPQYDIPECTMPLQY